MKTEIGNDVFLTHWETRKFSPQRGQNTNVELEATDCIIRKINADGEPIEVARGHVSQYVGDVTNSVEGRRQSFLKAISGLERPVRKALGHNYNRSCRVTPMSAGQTNRKLRKRIAELMKQLKAEKTEEVTA